MLRSRAPRLRLVSTNDAKEAAASQTRPVAELPVDDTELLAEMRAGDESAATAFHDRLRPRVDATIRRLLGGRDVDHEDLVQLSMLELVRSVERFRGDSSLESWAASVTAHVVYNHMRRRKIERRIFSSAAMPPDGPPSRSLASSLAARDVVQRIRVLLDDMDENKAWTFVLHDVCGFDLREIASITNVTVAAAQGRLVRGRREIHDRIAADPELANSLEETEAEA